MPSWIIRYDIGTNCSYNDIEEDEYVFRRDPSLVRYTRDQTINWGLAQATIEFSSTPSIQAATIMRLRNAEAVPLLPLMPRQLLRVEMDPEDRNRLSVGSVVCVDSNGKVGSTGDPIGILLAVDPGTNTAVVHFDPQGIPMRVSNPTYEMGFPRMGVQEDL